jgi:hypothetical protein
MYNKENDNKEAIYNKKIFQKYANSLREEVIKYNSKIKRKGKNLNENEKKKKNLNLKKIKNFLLRLLLKMKK